MARPMTPCRNTGSNRSGKMLSTSKRILLGVLDVKQPVGHGDPGCLHVHVEYSVSGRRYQVLDALSPGDPDVVGRSRDHVDQRAEVAPALGRDSHADQLMVVPAALGQLPQVRVWHFEVPATLSLSDGPGVDPHELDHKTWGLLPAPLDTTSLAIQEELGGRREAFW